MKVLVYAHNCMPHGINFHLPVKDMHLISKTCKHNSTGFVVRTIPSVYLHQLHSATEQNIEATHSNINTVKNVP